MTEQKEESYSGRKRRAEEPDRSDDVDDLVGQICAKLTNLKTMDRSQHMEAFIEVLECSTNEASFYLESASWDISTAVSLYLEEQLYLKRRATTMRMNEAMPVPPSPSFALVQPPRFEAKPVAIEGLPEGWAASVCPTSGQIVFFHTATMSRQYVVPPGFASLLGGQSLDCFQEDFEVTMPTLEHAFDDVEDIQSDMAVDGRVTELRDGSTHSADDTIG